MNESENSATLFAVLGETRMMGRRVISHLGAGKTFEDDFAHANFLLGPEQAAVDAAAHAIQQREPILQGRVGDLLPAIEALVAPEENPRFADVLGVALK